MANRERQTVPAPKQEAEPVATYKYEPGPHAPSVAVNRHKPVVFDKAIIKEDRFLKH